MPVVCPTAAAANGGSFKLRDTGAGERGDGPAVYEVAERALSAYWKNPRSLADALEADDLDPEAQATFELVAPNAVWDAGPFGTYRGRAEIASGWDDLLEVADDYRLSVRGLRACDDGRVFGVVDRTVKATASGIHTTIPAFVVIT